MSQWPSAKAKRVLAALLRIGWQIKRESGSHKVLTRPGSPDYVFAFHDNDEIGPKSWPELLKILVSSRQIFKVTASKFIFPILTDH